MGIRQRRAQVRLKYSGNMDTSDENHSDTGTTAVKNGPSGKQSRLMVSEACLPCYVGSAPDVT